MMASIYRGISGATRQPRDHCRPNIDQLTVILVNFHHRQQTLSTEIIRRKEKRSHFDMRKAAVDFRHRAERGRTASQVSLSVAPKGRDGHTILKP